MTTSDSTTNSAEDFTTEEILIALFCKVDDQCQKVEELRERHPPGQAPSQRTDHNWDVFRAQGHRPKSFLPQI